MLSPNGLRFRLLPANRVLRAVVASRLTYLEPEALMLLRATAAAIERRNIPGVFIECGCALGGSAIVIASAKRIERKFLIYDVFGTIPAPSTNDGADVHTRYNLIRSGQARGIGGDTYYGYRSDLIDEVARNFAEQGYPIEYNNIALVKGLYQSSLHVSEQVAFAHIDCDWYESVLICLTEIVPHLSAGGALVIDDYNFWSGCRRAVDDYFSNQQSGFEFEHGTRLIIRRKQVVQS
jgi:Macrocin-O-methyltransferase (TylF)